MERERDRRERMGNKKTTLIKSGSETSPGRDSGGARPEWENLSGSHPMPSTRQKLRPKRKWKIFPGCLFNNLASRAAKGCLEGARRCLLFFHKIGAQFNDHTAPLMSQFRSLLELACKSSNTSLHTCRLLCTHTINLPSHTPPRDTDNHP